MSKTKEELNALKEKEVEAESKEPRKLTDEELAQVSGDASFDDATGKYTIRCSNPGCLMNQNVAPTCWDPTNSSCPLCGGTLSFDFEPYAE